MLKLFILICTLSSCILSSQDLRVKYKYTSILDSTKRYSVSDEVMNLDIYEKKSIFYSNKFFIQDSIDKTHHQNSFTESPSVMYHVIKERPKMDVHYITSGLTSDLNVIENRKLEWKIVEEYEYILGYKSQMAETEFAGRKWIAYFTPDISINDGPYKFKGLPGLILKVADIGNNHRMEAISIEKILAGHRYDLDYNKYLEISQDKFKKLMIESRENPLKEAIQAYNNGDIPPQKDAQGNFVSPEEMVRKIGDMAKEAIKRDNNWLEIDILKEILNHKKDD